jgi:alkylation response protein AidB-like acyl-CoA dehydrogenase
MLRRLNRFKTTIARRSISFKLSSEQLELQDLARKFAANEIIPKAAEHDRTGYYLITKQISNGNPKQSLVLKSLHRQVGLLNTHVGEEYGGLGLGVLDCALISEEYFESDADLLTDVLAFRPQPKLTVLPKPQSSLPEMSSRRR